jgi:3-oxoacyl-[acyl-carrier protein] reductase
MRQKPAVVIFGGSGCLGQALIPKLTELGCQVIIADISRPPAPLHPDVKFYQCDATEPHDLSAFSQELIDKKIPVHHMVNTIGMLVESGLTDIFKTSADEIDKSFTINLKAQLLPVRFALDCLRQTTASNKSIVLTSSINASAGYSIAFYSAAKGGIESFIRPTAIQLGREGIRINAISPGSVITPDTAQQSKNFQDRAAAAAMRRLCTTDDIADSMIASMFLLKGMTGQTLVIDAGQSINPASSLYRQESRALEPDNHTLHLPDNAARLP